MSGLTLRDRTPGLLGRGREPSSDLVSHQSFANACTPPQVAAAPAVAQVAQAARLPPCGQHALWSLGLLAWAILRVLGSGDGQVGGAPATSVPVRVLDLDGRDVDPLDQPGSRAMVFIFTRTDCPVANRYAPAIQRLRDEFTRQQVTFRLVYVDPAEPAEAVRSHLRDYRYHIVALRDPSHALVALSGARATPEAAVFTSDRRLVYRGRIDDRYVDLNQVRAAPTRHDLREVLIGRRRGRPVTRDPLTP